MVRAMVTQQYTYAYGAVSPVDGRFDSLILPWVSGKCMQLFLDEMAVRYPDENIVMVLDGTKIKRLNWLKTYEPYFSRRIHPNSIRRNMFGMNSAKSSFTTVHSIAWTPWKCAWKRA